LQYAKKVDFALAPVPGDRRSSGQTVCGVQTATEGIGVGGESSLLNGLVHVRERRGRGKHRTEVTEVTEGDWGWWRKFFAGRVGSRARKTGSGKASHRGHGGDWGWWRKFFAERVGSRARKTGSGKASHGGHGGGLGLVANALRWTGWLRCETCAEGAKIWQPGVDNRNILP
jgi:hypothetical protein